MIVASSLTPVADQLTTLFWTLIAVSTLIWVIAAILCGRLCRQAIEPLTTICQEISAISIDKLDQRITTNGTNDEIQQLGRAFNSLLDRLQLGFECQRRFAAEASHQLRTPLTAMLGQVDVALRRDREAGEYKAALECVQRQSKGLWAIIESLLFLARGDADLASSLMEDVELNGWLERLLQSWSWHPRFDDLITEFRAPACFYVTTNRHLLTQAVGNLVDNAFKFSDPGSPVTIRISSLPPSISISDAGIGIDDEELGKVGEPFFRSNIARERGIQGNGLGLAVVKRLAASIGADFALESREGSGATAQIIFGKCQSPGFNLRMSKCAATKHDRTSETLVESATS